ncbi:hypothetical protein CC80DRAFT_576495 [Byssothecium circinans]|uniref:Uncharacterized protein n=1 Tax=Byssothecium circinans TaxID=147558 RepID=A0A6A5TGB7_9PLEO|nr:hypothetical protein CC80DRAFT_576495 [Byssothecium circinans]
MAETDRVTLAGTIGTWVAVCIGLVALTAVIGPFLIWAAARTERNKALHDAGDTKQPFIGSGIRFVGSDVRLFRRISAPILDQMPENPVLVWNTARFKGPNPEQPGFITFDKGNNLVIYCGTVILPVHRVWILIIGLIGRYSTKDSRPLRRKRNKSLSISFQTPKKDTSEDNTVESATWSTRVALNGTTGQIKISEKVSDLGLSESSIAMFLPLPKSEFAGIEGERLSLRDLFMLAIGCMPLPSQQYIALIELWVGEELEFDRHPMDIGTAPRAHTHTRVDSYFTEEKEPVALRLEKVTGQDTELERLRSTFGQMNQDVLAFEPQTLDQSGLADLRMNMSVTFIDPFFDWIRLPRPIMQVAHGLFSLPWHPQGYLIGGGSSAYCIQLLEVAGRELLYLLARVRENVERLDVVQQEKTRLKDTLTEVDKLVRREQSGISIPSHTEFYALDEILFRSGHSNPKINDIIGVLLITNEEFATFVRQSARHFDKSISASLEVALRTGYVKVKLPFGGVQDYPVDMEDLYTDWQPKDETIVVNYTVIMLACLRASMRSYLLNIRFDGHPLMREILQMDDRVYVA